MGHYRLATGAQFHIGQRYTPYSRLLRYNIIHNCGPRDLHQKRRKNVELISCPFNVELPMFFKCIEKSCSISNYKLKTENCDEECSEWWPVVHDFHCRTEKMWCSYVILSLEIPRRSLDLVPYLKATSRSKGAPISLPWSCFLFGFIRSVLLVLARLYAVSIFSLLSPLFLNLLLSCSFLKEFFCWADFSDS